MDRGIAEVTHRWDSSRRRRSPFVSVVIPTHDRDQLLRRALRSVLAQEYGGDVEVLVVFDGRPPDQSLRSDQPGRTVRVLSNDRTPGLAGSRNTGILAATGDLVGFCDDDDRWDPGKLTAQADELMRNPGGEFVTTAMTVECQGRRSVRLAGRDSVDHAALVRSRMAMLHSSSFLIVRRALLDDIGLVDETLPRSMAEDWDLLLRASRRRAIRHVDRPLVIVTWGDTSYFADRWQDRNDARLWLLEHHPDIAADARGSALTYGKLAFGCAALGQRGEAIRWAGRSIRARWREPRSYLAIAVASGVLPWRLVVRTLNRHGHGI